MRTQPQRGTVRVIRNASDARRDYRLPIAEAEALYRRSHLAWDATNECFCEKETNG